MSRRDIALKCIDITKGRGLELGPLFSPLVSKQEAKISYLDHVSTEDLKKKYDAHPIKGYPVPLESITPIDYVLENNSLKQTLRGKKFDYVIASHVMEHIPDLVSWLADVESILNEGGVLSLVIPDKRFTFDVLRDESRPADVIGAYLDKYNRASSVAMYDYMSNFRHNVVAAEAWQNPYADYSKNKKNTIQRAYEVCLDNIVPGNYVDAHCFVFTPYSFFEVVRSLVKHDLFGYEVAYFEDTPENQLEFYVSLRKVKQSSRARKLRSLPRLPKPAEKRELEQQVMDLKTESYQLQETITGLKSELNNLTTSKSWQLTKPIRQVVVITRKIRKK